MVSARLSLEGEDAVQTFGLPLLHGDCADSTDLAGAALRYWRRTSSSAVSIGASVTVEMKPY